MPRLCLIVFPLVVLLLAYWLSPFREQEEVAVQEKEDLRQTLELPVKAQPVRIRIAKIDPPKPPPVAKEEPKPKPQPKQKALKKPGAKGGGVNSGSLNIVGEFACDIDFYLAAMHRRGAQTMLYERTSRQMYALSRTGEIGGSAQLDAHFSQVTRRLTQDFPEASRVLRKAEILYGAGRYEILLLIPQPFADHVENLIRAALIQNGHESTNGTVFVRYKRSADQLLIDVYKAAVNGKTFRLNKQYAI